MESGPNLYRYAEAETLYERSLAISEKAFGPEHPRFSLLRRGRPLARQTSIQNVSERMAWARVLELSRRAKRGMNVEFLSWPAPSSGLAFPSALHSRAGDGRGLRPHLARRL